MKRGRKKLETKFVGGGKRKKTGRGENEDKKR